MVKNPTTNEIMKGYKATRNMKCKGFKYEVGKTYELEGELKMCENGFHFCQNQQDVLNYYGYDNDFILLEVEALGEVITQGNKSVTNKIRILRVVPREEWEFLEEGNVIHYKICDFESWTRYNDAAEIIHFRDNTRYEWWRKYDEKNRLIHFKSITGYQEWRKYSECGDCYWVKNSEGHEYRVGIIN